MPAPARVLFEMCLIAAVGVGLAAIANAVHPRGLSISRDYFPTFEALAAGHAPEQVGDQTPDDGGQAQPPDPDGAPPTADAPATDGPTADTPTADTPTADGPGADGPGAEQLAVAERLAEIGLSAIFHDDVVAAFEHEYYEFGAHVFIDARNQERYESGHIPGAWKFDHYHETPEDVVLACTGAMKIVVYCTGGQCEDSEIAAQYLLQFGVDGNVLTVYPGGIEEWIEHGRPVELGVQLSGEIVKPGDASYPR